MYVIAFTLGFFTSFGWWTAGKVQKAIDGQTVQTNIEVKKTQPDIEQ